MIAVAERPAIPVRVTYADGRPAPGAIVQAIAERRETTGQTDDDGRVRVVVGEPGRYQVRARVDAALPSAVVAVEVGPAAVAEVALTLERGVYVTGRVEPPVAADIDLQPDSSSFAAVDELDDAVTRAVRSEADGRFRLGPVTPGRYEVRGRAADGRTATRTTAIPSNGELVLALEDRGAIVGRVIDREQRPIPFAVVLVRPVTLRGRVVISDGVDTATSRVPSDAAGRFTVAGRDPGAWELIALDARGAGLRFADGRDRHVEHVEVTAGTTTEAVLVVEPAAGSIRGVVVDEANRPVADAWVSISDLSFETLLYGMPPGTAPELDRRDRRAGSSASGTWTVQDGAAVMRAGAIPTLLTGADGRFVVGGLRRGSYVVLAEAGRGGARSIPEELRVENDPVDVTVRVVSLGSIRGVVRAAGRPVIDFEIQVSGKLRAFHAEDGRFVIRGLNPGDHEVRAMTSSSRGSTKTALSGGGSAEVAIDLVADARVTGIIVDASGAPLGRKVEIFARKDTPEAWASARSGVDGRFSIRVPAGFRQVIVLGEGDFGHEVTLDLELIAGQLLDLGRLVPVAR